MCSFGWVFSVVHNDIDAPPDTVFAVLKDIEASPLILSAVQEIALIRVKKERNQGQDQEVADATSNAHALQVKQGLRWIEKRQYYHHIFMLYKSITQLEEEEKDPSSSSSSSRNRTIKVAVSLVEEQKYKSVVHTTTMTVQPMDDKGQQPQRSRIVGTYALQYNWRNRLKDICTFGFCRTRKAKRFFQNEILEYATEAERRHRKIRTMSDVSESSSVSC